MTRRTQELVKAGEGSRIAGHVAQDPGPDSPLVPSLPVLRNRVLSKFPIKATLDSLCPFSIEHMRCLSRQ